MTISIRPIKPSDKVRWLELFQEYIVFYKSKLSVEQFDLTWQRINSDFNINALVAELDGKVVGFTHYIWRPDTWEAQDFCYLEDLYTDPKVRGKGVGRALIKAVEDIAIAKGSKQLYWTTAPDNELARALYDKIAITNMVEYKIYLNK
jgi:GNAT superfamily N-acetyltransferase